MSARHLLRSGLTAVWLLGLPLAASAGGDPSHPTLPAGFVTGFATIRADEVQADVECLADPALEGRDTPSLGLERAADYVARRFAGAGLATLPDRAGYLWTFGVEGWVPDPAASSLVIEGVGGSGVPLELGMDWVPLPGCNGDAEGPVVFLGFGIDSRRNGYNDLRGHGIRGAIALIVEGEPLHGKKFEGPEISFEANVFRKLANLEKKGVAGVIVVRRPQGEREAAPAPDPEPEPDREPEPRPERPALGFRHTWAIWTEDNDTPEDPPGFPVAEVSLAAAARILGQDVAQLVAQIDASAKPVRSEGEGRSVHLVTASAVGDLAAPNVVGVIPGTDPTLADEYVVLGAHLDHVGVDARTRVGCGADDNASGISALLEVAEGLARAGPRRSFLVCAFSGEEDGMLGSQAFVDDLPVPREKVVAMLNMDMVGRGPVDECAVLGVKQNPELGELLERALELQPTGVDEVYTKKAQELFQRSDHYSFHRARIPALFFFEDTKIANNQDYHTWRDTADGIDFEKIASTARLIYNTAWLLASEDERPPSPRR